MKVPDPLTPEALRTWADWLWSTRLNTAPADDIEQALAAARRFGDLDTAVVLMLVLAREAHLERRFARSRTWLDQARATAATPVAQGRVALRFTRYFQAVGHRDRALTESLAARDLLWDHDRTAAMEAWLDATLLRVEDGDPSDVPALTDAIAASGSDRLAYRMGFLRFRAAMVAGDLDGGAAVLDAMAHTYADDVQRLCLVWLNQATLALLSEDPDEADQRARAAVDANPRLREAMLLRARAAARRGDGEQALAWMDELVTERPDATLRGPMQAYVALTRVAARVACDADPAPTDLVGLERIGPSLFSMPVMEGLEALRWAETAQAHRGSARSARTDRCVRLLALAHRLLSTPLPDRTAEAERALQRLYRDGAGVPLGPWTLIEPLAQGAQGAVWRARHVGSGQAAAVKVQHDPDGRDADNELLAIARLSHPGIVALYDHGRIPPHAEAMTGGQLRTGAPWMALELVQGGSLRQACGRLPWGQVRSVATTLLDALAHAHARDVLHLDVKPHNVLLQQTADGTHVQLTDFGLATTAEQARGRILGTPAYMSPEQARGQWRSLGPPTDLYGLGATLWHLVTGSVPFLPDTRPTERPPLPPLRPRFPVPAGTEAWLGRLLAEHPGDRFPTAAHAARALATLPTDLDHDPLGDATSSAPLRMAGTTVVLGGGDDAPLSASHTRSAWFDLPRQLVPETPGAPQRPAGDRLLAPRPVLRGRDELQAALWSEVHDAIGARAPSALTVAGPQGVGVSAVLQWLGERAAEQGVRWLSMVAGQPLWGPFVRWTRLQELAPAARVQQLAATLRADPQAPWLRRLARSDRADPALVAQALAAWAADRPVLLTIDDAHPSAVAHQLVRQLLEEGGEVAERAAGPPPLLRGHLPAGGHVGPGRGRRLARGLAEQHVAQSHGRPSSDQSSPASGGVMNHSTNRRARPSSARCTSQRFT